jgi:hypothetical protein
MRTTRTVTSLQKSVSPHISSSVRKTMIHDRHSNNNSNDHDHDHAQDSKMGMSPEFAASKADSNSIATSATEHSSPFFADATFEMKSSSPIDVEYLKRTERILRFAQKRLKKSCSEDFFERKQKKSTQPQEILHVQHSDVELDAIVGNGSYNIVYSVKRIKGSNTNRSSSQSNLQFEPENVVVKTLRPKLLTDLPMLAACAADRTENTTITSSRSWPGSRRGCRPLPTGATIASFWSSKSSTGPSPTLSGNGSFWRPRKTTMIRNNYKNNNAAAFGITSGATAAAARIPPAGPCFCPPSRIPSFEYRRNNCSNNNKNHRRPARA